MSTIGGIVKRYLGEIGTLSTEKGQLAIRVSIKDVRSAFGRYDFLVEPVSGAGEAWVSAQKVQFDVDDNGGRLM